MEYLTQLIGKYQNLVFTVCVRMVNDYFVAEDLTQETFLSAFKNISSFDGANEKAWLCRIASNKCIDYQKQAARRILPTEDEELERYPMTDGQPEEGYMEKETYLELSKRCKSLKPPYDEIAELYFVQEHSAEEIADMKQRNKKTVQTQIYRARAMLRKIYEKERG